MQYLSPEFGFAFLVFLWLYWLVFARLGTGAQNFSLLVASYLFYACINWKFVVILFIFSLWILTLAQLSERRSPRERHPWRNKEKLKQKPRRWPIVIGVISAVINLGVFKYYNFFRESFAPWFTQLFQTESLPVLDFLLPVGISFYTFQGIAYLVSVGRDEHKPVDYLPGLLHLSFFPTLLAGPICRADELLPQIQNPEPRKISQGSLALWLIILALIKKVWLAAWLAETWVNPLFNNPEAFHPLELMGGLVAYAWQLFFDFSGYTNLVTAFALLLGFELPKNFAQPYLALTLADFWRRWHMTLSRWIRDFIYIPLGGNRGSWLRTQSNAVIAMVLSGLWHGASVNFILWGLWHGIGLVVQHLWQKILGFQLPKIIAGFITFSFICLGWLLFRASDYDGVQNYWFALSQWQHALQLNLLGLIAAVSFFFMASINSEKISEFAIATLNRLPGYCQAFFLVIIAWLVIHLAPEGMPGFIYFGF